MLTERIVSHYDLRLGTLLNYEVIGHNHSGRYHDLNWLNHLTNFVVDAGVFDVRDFTNIADSDTLSSDTTLLVFEGTPPRRSASPLVDSNYHRIMTHFENTQQLFGNWEFAGHDVDVPHENPVTHYNIVGQTRVGGDDRPLLYEFQEPATHSSFTTRWETVTYAMTGDRVTFGLGTPDQDLVPITGILRPGSSALSWEFMTSFDFYSSVMVNGCRNPKLYRSGNHIVLYFQAMMGSKLYGSNDWAWDLYEYRINLSVNPTPVVLDSSFDGSFCINDVFLDGNTVEQTSYQQIWYNPPTIPTTRSSFDSLYSELRATRPVNPMGDWTNDEYYGVWDLSQNPIILTGPNFGSVRNLIRIDDTSLEPPEYSYSHVMDWHRRDLGNFSSGCFFSSKDALDNAFSALDSNHIETLLEIRSLADPIRITQAFLKLRESGWNVFSRFLDVISDAHLSWSFGLAPTISEADKLATKGRNLRSRLFSGVVFRPQTAYGSQVYPLEGVAGYSDFPSAKAICRSKIRLGYNLDGFLPYLITLDSVGLLPRLSRIWAIIPFSFLVDKVSNTGPALEYIETSLLGEVLDIKYSTHSVDILLPFRDIESRYGFSSVPVPIAGTSELHCGYKSYMRFSLDGAIPGLGPTKLPILGDFTGLSWGITGALLYKAS